jgi:hypothetical protein
MDQRGTETPELPRRVGCGFDRTDRGWEKPLSSRRPHYVRTYITSQLEEINKKVRLTLKAAVSPVAKRM